MNGKLLPGICLCMVLALLLLLTACGTDAVVVRPGRYYVSDETETGEAVSSLAETSVPEPVEPTNDPYLAAAGDLLDDPQFAALAESFGGIHDSRAVAAALLSIFDGQKNGESPDETVTGEIPDRTIPGDYGNTDEAVVFWTSGGSVWHTKESCSALARSENIRSGTTEDAQKAGMERVCKRCG
ncbi:MAG: hypothetical protein MJ175_06175 [Clostridia bacterium]|nr:hypothetical protein [Clostridia bacterium]